MVVSITLLSILLPAGPKLIDLEPRASAEYLDPSAASRFQFVTRSLIGDGEEFFSDRHAHAGEASMYLQVGQGIALTAHVPFAYVSEGFDPSEQAVMGNASLGLIYGTHRPTGMKERLFLGAAADVYFPTTPQDTSASASPSLLAAAVRGDAPQSFLPGFTSVRVRGHIGYLSAPFKASAEAHIIPGLFTSESDPFALLGTASGQIGLEFQQVDLYVRGTQSFQITGSGTVDPPFLLTPGIAVRPVKTVSLGLFSSINFEASTALIVGFELSFLNVESSSRTAFDEDDDGKSW